jgi:hypothetical protein
MGGRADQITAYHPGLDRVIRVAPSAMANLRQAGWLTLAEHRANEAQRLAAEAGTDDTEPEGGATRPAGGSSPSAAAGKARVGGDK